MINNIIAQRIEKLRTKLEQTNNDGILISNTENCRYLSGFTSSDQYVAFLLITPTDLILITDYRYAEQAESECHGYEVIVRDRQNLSLGQQLRLVLNRIKVKHLAFEESYLNVTMFAEIQAQLQFVTMHGITGWVERQRMVKDRTEISNIAAAAEMADTALAKLVPNMKEGATERDLALELEYQLQKLGSEGLSFATILLSGTRTSLPHGIPSNKQLKAGDLITLDFGAVVNGYRSDMTRAFVVGEASRQQKDVYQTVKEAQKAGIESIRAGINGTIPFFRSKRILDSSPYHAYQGEGIGHGIGLYLHEQPFLQSNCEITLEENMVITVEPGIYIPQWGGIRIEDDILVKKEGFKILTRSPDELLVI